MPRIIWIVLLTATVALYWAKQAFPPPSPIRTPAPPQAIPLPKTAPPKISPQEISPQQLPHPPQNIPRTFLQKLCSGGFQPTSATNSSKIYRTETDGTKSYSDKRTPSAQDISSAYATKKYFSLQLDSTRTLPPLLQENLRRDITAIYQFLSQKLLKEHLTQTQLRMTIASTPQDFDQILKDFYSNNAAPFKPSGFYTYGYNRTFVKQSRHTRSTARHEATHAINAVLFGRTPKWFNEGIAVYFGSQNYLQLQQGTTRVSAHRMQRLKKILSQPFSLTEFLSHNEQELLNYSIGWSLIYFLNHHSNHTASYTARQTIFTQMLHNLANHRCQNPDLTQLINKHYPGGITQFENTWAQWINSHKA